MLQTIGKDRLSIEKKTGILTDGTSWRSATKGTRFATFKFNNEHSKTSKT
jgi:hypothetical protein